MIYRVVLDDNDILNYQEQRYVLLSPSLNLELNAAGSLEFTMPPGHPFYDSVRPLLSTIEVYEDGELLWFGRPVEYTTDFWKQRQVYCEGALSFFNDTIQRPREYEQIGLHAFFNAVIDSHNAQVSNLDRQFTVGRVTVENREVYRKLDYNTTFDVLKTMCVGAEGGYLILRRENGINYIDWLKDLPYSCNQPVEFGLNMLDLSTTFNGASIATCIVPLGDALEEDVLEDLGNGLYGVVQAKGEKLSIATVNNRSDMIVSEAANVYGRITKVVEFSGVKDAAVLYDRGLAYLKDTQFDDMTIECSAAELHLQNPNYNQFRIGQSIRCRSIPHLLDREFPLVSLSIKLDTAAKRIALGTTGKQTLTRIYRDAQSEGSSIGEEDSLHPGGDPGEDTGGGNAGGLDERLTELEARVAALENDGWIHQINGEESQTGTVNFITD